MGNEIEMHVCITIKPHLHQLLQIHDRCWAYYHKRRAAAIEADYQVTVEEQRTGIEEQWWCQAHEVRLRDLQHEGGEAPMASPFPWRHHAILHPLENPITDHFVMNT